MRNRLQQVGKYSTGNIKPVTSSYPQLLRGKVPQEFFRADPPMRQQSNNDRYGYAVPFLLVEHRTRVEARKYCLRARKHLFLDLFRSALYN